MSRVSIPPRSPFEKEIGFTRALRVGQRIEVSGTVGIAEDGSVPESAREQADRCFALIADHIERLDGKVSEIVRIRMFVTDMAYADDVSAAFAAALQGVRPTATLVGVTSLYDPSWKVEIEAEAQVGET
ncbi:RidA family protein [Altererythrobacter indicus]|uniref:RidA family protein n=1 Tax=Altericroceibacterium indicum TaxID=374177 RepID=A0A845AHZ2_9SPHN|nr:Rid family hydrolase [Altericroceibacterium indicum]MXP26728.1 RidA family protein [Altericroceibacterium indicum]